MATHLSRMRWPSLPTYLEGFLSIRLSIYIPIYLLTYRPAYLPIHFLWEGMPTYLCLSTYLPSYLSMRRWSLTYLSIRRWPPLSTYLGGDGHLSTYSRKNGHLSTYFEGLYRRSLVRYLPLGSDLWARFVYNVSVHSYLLSYMTSAENNWLHILWLG